MREEIAERKSKYPTHSGYVCYGPNQYHTLPFVANSVHRQRMYGVLPPINCYVHIHIAAKNGAKTIPEISIRAWTNCSRCRVHTFVLRIPGIKIFGEKKFHHNPSLWQFRSSTDVRIASPLSTATAAKNAPDTSRRAWTSWIVREKSQCARENAEGKANNNIQVLDKGNISETISVVVYVTYDIIYFQSFPWLSFSFHVTSDIVSSSLGQKRHQSVLAFMYDCVVSAEYTRHSLSDPGAGWGRWQMAKKNFKARHFVAGFRSQPQTLLVHLPIGAGMQ